MKSRACPALAELLNDSKALSFYLRELTSFGWFFWVPAGPDGQEAKGAAED